MTFGTCGHEIAIRVIPFIVNSATVFLSDKSSFIDLDIKMGFRVMVITCTFVTPTFSILFDQYPRGKGPYREKHELSN